MGTTVARPIPTVRPAARPVPRRAGFWILAAALFALMAAAGAPSPLYVLYQQQWHFSAPMLTLVFAVYALALLAALLTVGALSGYVGRRPVLVAALGGEIAAMAVFLSAHGVGALLVARILQGLATGAATGAVSAALVDLQPAPGSRLGAVINSVAPTAGLAAGALGAGALAEYAPSPTVLVFALLLVVFVALVAAIALVPETVTRRPGALASLRPRMSVPAEARSAFRAATPAMIATWATGGLFLSLGGSLAAGVLHIGNHLVGGLTVTVLTGAGALASLPGGRRPARAVMAVGAFTLATGAALTMVALTTRSTGLFFLAAVIAGAGFGSTFSAAFRSLAPLAGPDRRAELFASVYTVSYLAFSLPAVAAGLLVPHLGLRTVADGYGVGVVLLALAAGALALRRRHPAAAGADARP
ncbi:MFS transporter [Kitasatospora sp. NPDC059571]|uniref:MFS transporter n=1 Tax=Kitasatospora sp. NPDC059571 TaxID=3346871 RepID=UPI0036A83D3E